MVLYTTHLDTSVRFVPIGNTSILDQTIYKDMSEYTMSTRTKTILFYGMFLHNVQMDPVAVEGEEGSQIDSQFSLIRFAPFFAYIIILSDTPLGGCSDAAPIHCQHISLAVHNLDMC